MRLLNTVLFEKEVFFGRLDDEFFFRIRWKRFDCALKGCSEE